MNGFVYVILMLWVLGLCIYIKDLALKYFPKLKRYSQRRQYIVVFVLFLAASRGTMFIYEHGSFF